jgi:hypothetical protein
MAHHLASAEVRERLYLALAYRNYLAHSLLRTVRALVMPQPALPDVPLPLTNLSNIAKATAQINVCPLSSSCLITLTIYHYRLRLHNQYVGSFGRSGTPSLERAASTPGQSR